MTKYVRHTQRHTETHAQTHACTEACTHTDSQTHRHTQTLQFKLNIECRLNYIATSCDYDIIFFHATARIRKLNSVTPTKLTKFQGKRQAILYPGDIFV